MPNGTQLRRGELSGAPPLPHARRAAHAADVRRRAADGAQSAAPQRGLIPDAVSFPVRVGPARSGPAGAPRSSPVAGAPRACTAARASGVPVPRVAGIYAWTIQAFPADPALSQRRVWVSTARGVGYMEAERFVPLDGVPAGVTRAIVEDRNRTLWFVNVGYGALAMREDREGALWPGVADGIWRRHVRLRDRARARHNDPGRRPVPVITFSRPPSGPAWPPW